MSATDVHPMLAQVAEIPEEDRYDGPVCFKSDGWHYTVEDDSASKDRAVKIAQVDYEFAQAVGIGSQITLAEQNLRIVKKKSHEKPGQKLYSDGRGNYRLATDDDLSHNDQFHIKFATVEPVDGGPALRVTEEDMADIRKMLAEKHKNDGA